MKAHCSRVSRPPGQPPKSAEVASEPTDRLRHISNEGYQAAAPAQIGAPQRVVRGPDFRRGDQALAPQQQNDELVLVASLRRELQAELVVRDGIRAAKIPKREIPEVVGRSASGWATRNSKRRLGAEGRL
jgi:hypothetical protein